MHRFDGRGMDRVTAKIAQKISMFFENDRIDAGAGKENPAPHPGGSAANNAAAAGECLRGLVHRPPSIEADRGTIHRSFVLSSCPRRVAVSARGEPKYRADEACDKDVSAERQQTGIKRDAR